ncbi:MAG: hypothetical protein ABW104_19305 [Candidatus Thiodiazotropha sp. 6PLUC2]
MLPANNEPMGIALLGMSRKDKPMMELFLQRNWSSNCIVVPEHQAKLCILDLDGIEGRKLLQQQQDQYNERPLIVLSVHEKEIDGARVLRKPLRMDSLKGAIEIYRSELIQRPTESENQKPITSSKSARWRRTPSSTINQNTDTNERREVLPDATSQARIIQRACSLSIGTSDLDNKDFINGMYYQHTSNLQDILKQAIERCRRDSHPIRLSFQDGKSVTLLPQSNLSVTDLNDVKLRPRCLLTLNSNQIKIEPSINNETHLLRSYDALPLPIDALLWKITLWSSRGRLPKGASTNVAVGLRQWPNLTRLFSIPEFFRIAALWSKTPLSIARTVDTLNIEYGYVCAFFSACHALDLIQVHDADYIQSVSENSDSRKVLKSGILRRLLRRLRAV